MLPDAAHTSLDTKAHRNDPSATTGRWPAATHDTDRSQIFGSLGRDIDRFRRFSAFDQRLEVDPSNTGMHRSMKSTIAKVKESRAGPATVGRSL